MQNEKMENQLNLALDATEQEREKSLDLGALRETHAPEQLIGTLAFLAGLQPKPAPAAPADLAAGFAWKNVRSDNVVIHSEFGCDIS